MKKIFALLLVAAVCFSLVACSSGETPNTDDNSDTVQNGQNNNSQEGTQNNNTGNNGGTTIQYGIGESAFADHPLLPCIYGTWEFVSCNSPWDYTWYKTLTINHDGTCIVDDVAGNWKVEDDSTNMNTLHIGLYVDNECIYGTKFGANFDGVYLLATDSTGMPQQTNFTCINPEYLYSSIDNFGSLCNTWYINDIVDAVIQTVVIENSGKCVLDGQTATWDFYMDYTDGHHEPIKLGIVISIDGEAAYYGQLIGEDVFKLMDIDGKVCGEYSSTGN